MDWHVAMQGAVDQRQQLRRLAGPQPAVHFPDTPRDLQKIVLSTLLYHVIRNRAKRLPWDGSIAMASVAAVF